MTSANNDIEIYRDSISVVGTSKADTIESGAHVGSQGVKKPIHEFQPNINICGHVHEACSIDMVGNTTVANPGRLEEGHAILIEVDENAMYTIGIVSLE